VKFTELAWDEKLTLEFTDAQPALSTIEITNAENPITIFIAGDSTVSDWAWEPWTSWGQQLPRWFREPVLIANLAEPGETTASFVGEKRWPKMMRIIKPGDYVLMQFGHNDLAAVQLPRFKQYFVDFIKETKDHGATPVLVTPMNRRTMDANGKVRPSLGEYPEAIRQVAREQGVALIDLNAMSVPLYEALPPDDLRKAFVDGTHFTEYGSYELAKCVVQGIIDAKLPWAQYITDDWKKFDPAHPDALADFKLPRDPQQDPMPTATRPTTRAGAPRGGATRATGN
jgi:lysophospholipase L1-like esterase